MKYYIIAGEASGDLHGSNLMKAIKKIDNDVNFRFWGGDKMSQVGGTMVEHYRNMAFMGFVEVIKNLRTILSFIKRCKADILTFKPDVIILIDYPGFNLRMAKWAKKMGFKVVYYITPQVWAWHKSRVFDLGKYTDRLLVILPFESDFFMKYGINTDFVGHPLLDAIKDFKPNKDFVDNAKKDDKPILALLPGSRKQEIAHILPQMLEGIQKNNYNVIVGCANAVDDSFYLNIIKKSGIAADVKLVKHKTYDLLSIADYALVGSGTATLETALFGVPQIVCYKGGSISYAIAKRLVNLKYISLVNLISDKEVVKELIQNELTAKNIKDELENLLKNKSRIKHQYHELNKMLGQQGASDKAANIIYQLVS